MSWFLENNIATLTHGGKNGGAQKKLGVAIPPCLVSFLSPERRNVIDSTMWIPFIRKLVKGKNGKNSIKQIDPMVDVLFIDHKVGATSVQQNRIKTQEVKSSGEKKMRMKAGSTSCPRK
eukprot:867808_1